VVTLETGANAILRRVLVLKKAMYVPDTREESDWRDHKAFAGFRSWIAVPLVVSDSVLGCSRSAASSRARSRPGTSPCQIAGHSRCGRYPQRAAL